MMKVSDEQKQLIADFLQKNPDMHELLKSNPKGFAEKVLADENLKKLFAGINLEKLSEGVK